MYAYRYNHVVGASFLRRTWKDNMLFKGIRISVTHILEIPNTNSVPKIYLNEYLRGFKRVGSANCWHLSTNSKHNCSGYAFERWSGQELQKKETQTRRDTHMRRTRYAIIFGRQEDSSRAPHDDENTSQGVAGLSMMRSKHKTTARRPRRVAQCIGRR